MIDLTPEVRRAIEDAGGEPTRLVDSETHAEYVLLRADLYDRIRSVISAGGGLESAEMTSHMWEVMKDEWDDPAMDVYDNYPEAM